MSHVEILEDVAALAERAARFFTETAHHAIMTRGQFTVALAGGSTPLRMYDLLAWDPFVSAVNWTKTFIFWGDERCVPPSHIDSNFQQANVQLLSKIDIPSKNVHRIHGELSASAAAELYQSELEKFFGRNPVFDLILLGIGPDGHTASLFPGSAALDETSRWVVGVPHSTPPPPLVDRVTLTLPVINAARKVLFLAAGAGKTAILSQVLGERVQDPLLPSQRVNPTHGELTWMVEKSAMGKIERP